METAVAMPLPVPDREARGRARRARKGGGMSSVVRGLIGVLLLATALGGFALATAAQNREVNVYSSRHYDTDAQLFAAFTARTGIRVNVIEAAKTSSSSASARRGPTARPTCSSR